MGNVNQNHSTATEATDRDARILRQGKKLFIRELGKQLAQLQALLAGLERAPDEEDMKQFYRIAHTLKGSAPIFGYGRIGKLCEELVRQWEWTQTPADQPFTAACPPPSLEESVEFSKRMLLNMTMESHIIQTELQMDEKKDPTGSSLLSALKCRLLLVDDDDVLRSYLVRRLQLDDCMVDEAADVQTAKRLLREHVYDVVILDLMMHPQSGYELFEFVKEDPTLKWLPLIVLSGRSDLNDKVRCFHLGADDYVTKPFQYEELAARIYGLLKRAKNFEHLAFRDPLTGVFNRRYFDLQVGIELQRFDRDRAPLSLAFIDIDRFKSINDTYGHHAGDLVLQGLSHLLLTHIRSTDLLARFGGEEFVLVLPDMTAEQSVEAVSGILQEARRKPMANCSGTALSITFSAGVAEWQSGMSIEDWLKTADAAMYQAKQQGRDRVLSVSWNQGGDGASPDARQGASKRKRLLIVDDDQILRSILVSHLERLPVDIVEAADGREALELLKDADTVFDACILDGVMPHLNGFNLLQHLRGDKEPLRREMRILLLSGKKKEDDLAKGLHLGADDYMTKPFSLVELETRVKQLLEL